MKSPFRVERIDFSDLESDIMALKGGKLERNLVVIRFGYVVMTVVSRFRDEDLIGVAFEKLIELLDNLPNLDRPDAKHPYVAWILVSLRGRLLDHIKEDKLLGSRRKKIKLEKLPDIPTKEIDDYEVDLTVFTYLERKVIELRLDECTNAEIAATIGGSVRTVNRHIAEIKRKLLGMGYGAGKVTA